MSRNDIVLLAWGSRSMSSVGWPRSASAAARLMAVVVFPTPPFWLAMATIIGGTRADAIVARKFAGGVLQLRFGEAPKTRRRDRRAPRLHFVLAEVVRIEA